DHIVHAQEIADICGADIFIGVEDYAFLSDPALSLCAHFGSAQPKVNASILYDGDVIEGFTVYHTPGHTCGSVCLYRENTLVGGDTVFPTGLYGRTDLPTGNDAEMQSSLQRLNELHVDSIWCGHGKPIAEGAQKHLKLSLENVKRNLLLSHPSRDP
ncbi:MAG TPA: MBL fold metallo-hydrolase, partial [Methanocorpusculum sp.]|nr:MBL fold metallo-hydrolase [Methanocorpusculum sp.]